MPWEDKKKKMDWFPDPIKEIIFLLEF